MKILSYLSALMVLSALFIAHPAQAETLENPTGEQMAFLYYHLLGEEPPFKEAAESMLRNKRFNEFEKGRAVEAKIKELKDRYQGYDRYDRIVFTARENLSEYDFDKRGFYNSSFSDTSYYPFSSPFGGISLRFSNAGEFYFWPMEANEAEELLKKLDYRRVNMEMEILLMRAEKDGRDSNLYGHVKKVTYMTEESGYGRNKKSSEKITTLHSEVEPTIKEPEAAPEYPSSENLGPSDIDYKGLKIGMSATEFVEWAKTQELGKRPNIDRSLRDYKLPREKPSGFFSSGDWAYMDSNIKRIIVGEFDWDHFSCKVGLFCADASFDEDGKLTKIKFRDVYPDTKEDQVLPKLKEKYGAPVFELEGTHRTGGDIQRNGIYSVNVHYMGFGKSVEEAEPYYKDMPETRYVATMRVGDVYSKTYIEGFLHNLEDVKAPKNKGKEKKKVSF